MGFTLLCAILLRLLAAAAAAARGSPELQALMEVKAALDPDRRQLASWTADSDPCGGGFEGVVCNEHGKVANISLQGKGMKGTISPAISELRWLSGLYLHYNALSGVIPREIGNLTELSELYLNVNNLSGSIPEEIGSLGSLQVLQLCYNQLSGGIPTQLGLLEKLNVLALQSNRFTGAIPATLGDLDQLIRLDLSYNQLFGSIPTRLAQAPQLMVLDVRNNSLSGNVPSDLKRMNEGFQYENNTDLCGVGYTSLRSCTSADILNPHRPESSGPGSTTREIPQSANLNAHCNATSCLHSSKSHALAAIVGVSTVVVAGIISGLLAFSWYHHRRRETEGALEVTESQFSTDYTKGLNQKSVTPLISLEYSDGWDPLADGRSGVGFSEKVSQSFRFNLEEVECATQHFSEVNLLRRESNFTATYKGTLRDGTVVAVKRINKTSCKSEDVEFLEGMKMLTLLRHENLVGLRGFCCSRGRGECFLVYDFVANGNLSQYLDVKDNANDRILGWSTRVSIIKAIARGIEYLHCSRANKPSLVHQNIAAEKILIDENFNSLLSDSGLYKLLADDIVFSSLKASAAMGYLAPEYATIGRFTEKSDVYAYGVLVFQIITGKRETAHLRLGPESGNLEDLIDRNLKGIFCRSEAAKLATIALKCSCEDPNKRPTMEAVLQELSSSSSVC